MLPTEAAPAPEDSGNNKELKSKKRKKAKRDGIESGNPGELNKDLAICKSEADMKKPADGKSGPQEIEMH